MTDLPFSYYPPTPVPPALKLAFPACPTVSLVLGMRARRDFIVAQLEEALRLRIELDHLEYLLEAEEDFQKGQS